jgi:DNA invertase Pin-like site-specific DNA recombinase
MPSPTSTAPVAYSYIRFSHPDQAKGDSVRRQTEQAREWCKRHGLRLDENTTLRDLGKSAYTGEHRRNPDRHALATFLKLVEAGKVPRGSFLIIENLDRLSREDERSALRLWMDILDQGVNIVQLKPETIFRHEKSDMMDIMRAIIELSRGHGESARKSERNGAAWAERRRRVRENGAILTKRLPAWIEERGGKLRLIPRAAAAVKRIFALAATGYGGAGIVKKLTQCGVPPFGRCDHWSNTYVDMILRDRRALGELQPRRIHGEADGEPIRDYYPAAVSQQEWDAARAGAVLRARRTGKGPRWTKKEDVLALSHSPKEAAARLGRTVAAVNARKNALAYRDGRKPKSRKTYSPHVNVFSGLVYGGHDGGSYFLHTRSSATYGTRWRVLLNTASVEGRAPVRSFPFDVFERAVLSLLKEIDPREILNGDHVPDETQAIAGELTRTEAKIGELEAELENGVVAALARKLRELEARKRDLVTKLADARQKAAHPLSEVWGEAGSLIEALDDAPDPVDARTRLRAVLRRMIDSVWILPVPRGRDRLCAVQVWFAGAGRCRAYLILNRPPHSAGKGRSAGGGWGARSLAEVLKPSDLDLRKPGDVKAMEAGLLGLDVEALAKELEVQ